MLTTYDLPRPADPTAGYFASYLLIRSVLGFIGVLLPVAFIVGEAFFIDGGVQVRGSLSAYYHSPMRDLFVAGLAVTGFLLLTYMAGQSDRLGYWLSSLAGVAVLAVAFLPTGRPGVAGAPKCGSLPEPPGCSAVQQRFGEDLTAWIHYAGAAVFILGLAAIAFLFAWQERAGGAPRRGWWPSRWPAAA